jgi:hypothetical protein
MRTLLLLLATALASETEVGSGTTSSAGTTVAEVIIYALAGIIATVGLVTLFRWWCLPEANRIPPEVNSYRSDRRFAGYTRHTC